MVLPSDELCINIKHVGICDGNVVVKVHAWRQRGDCAALYCLCIYWSRLTGAQYGYGYIAHQQCWVDLSLCNLTKDWLCCIKECFTAVANSVKASILQSYMSLDKPHSFVKEFFKAYLRVSEQLLTMEDKTYFLAILQYSNLKPSS